jgi:glycosyltransferase involved in cell wall biosynthesis
MRHPWSWEARKVFVRLLDTEPVDIVETADFGAWGWHFVGNRRVPVVVRCHTPSHVLWAIDHVDLGTEKWPSNVKKQDDLERLQAQRADGISAPSQALACHLSLSWRIPLGRFSVIANPIDCDLFHPAPQDNRDTEILYIGRLDYFKGVYDLAEAAIPILERHERVRLHLVGMDRPSPARYRHLGATASQAIRALVPARFHNRVLFTPHVPVSEVVKHYQNAWCAVMPTRGFESFSYTVIEAMACGTPTIATRCGGPAEIITDHEDGLLVPPGNPAALTDALEAVVADSRLRAKLATEGRRTAQKQFALPIVVPQMVDWYQRIIESYTGD